MIINGKNAAYLVKYSELNSVGKKEARSYAFVFEEDRQIHHIEDALNEIAVRYFGRCALLKSIRPIRPNENITVDILFDYRSDNLPMLKEAS